MNKNEDIYYSLLRTYIPKRKKILTNRGLYDVFEFYGQDKEKTKKYLLQQRKLLTIIAGAYYLKEPNEFKLPLILSPEEMVAGALNELNIKWYFGLHTALRHHNLISQIPVRIQVINAKRRGKRSIEGKNFEFQVLKDELLSFGVEKKKTKNNIVLRYSDPEKTVLDIAYLALRKGDPAYCISFLNEFVPTIDLHRLRSYLAHYPATLGRDIDTTVEGGSNEIF